MKKSLFILAAILPLAACAPGENEYASMTDEQIFERGKSRILDEDFKAAAMDFDMLENQHPYSRFTARGQLLGGYASYRAGRYKEAAESFEKYMKFQPSSAEIPYATYMAANSNFAQMRRVERDQKETAVAAAQMERLIREWPKSEFAADVKPRLMEARATIAAKEMRAGAELARGRNFPAALNHYQIVITKFRDTPYAPEAYFRAAEIYRIIGDDNESEKLLAILRKNFPGSDFAK